MHLSSDSNARVTNRSLTTFTVNRLLNRTWIVVSGNLAAFSSCLNRRWIFDYLSQVPVHLVNTQSPLIYLVSGATLPCSLSVSGGWTWKHEKRKIRRPSATSFTHTATTWKTSPLAGLYQILAAFAASLQDDLARTAA